ncbi:hypothetical protein N9Y42_03480 [Mariniblastus sp.]|nr:hypothetical protein [Mariniblastus sp.]
MKPVNISAIKQLTPPSNPISVLRSIGATQGMGASPAAEISANSERVAEDQPAVAEELCSPPTLKLMVPEPDLPSYDPNDILQTTIESAKQIQQLAERLKQNQAELASKEVNLEASIAQHEATAVQAEQKIEKRLSQLQQQMSQVRLQQRHVMHLQSSIVDSHEASKIAIEQLVSSELTDASTLRHMKTIQHEISERYDYISRRWQHLFQLLENQRVQQKATQGLRDVA